MRPLDCMRRGACISLLPLAGHVIISAMNALPTPPHSFGVRMCRIARGGFPRPWALHQDADRPYSSNTPIRQTQRSLLGRAGRAAAGLLPTFHRRRLRPAFHRSASHPSRAHPPPRLCTHRSHHDAGKLGGRRGLGAAAAAGAAPPALLLGPATVPDKVGCLRAFGLLRGVPLGIRSPPPLTAPVNPPQFTYTPRTEARCRGWRSPAGRRWRT